MVVSTAPTSTTNITGFLTMVRGCNLRNESPTARDMMALSRSDFFRIWATWSIGASEEFSCLHQQVFENWPETQGREKGKSADDQHGGNEQTGEETAGDGESSRGFGNGLLPGEATGDGHDGDDHEEASE